ncbi:MAG: DUF1080 domain-containing protein [Prevotella sp.]|nr:DUF1080 domain-containing protein [Prevotella sp.]
MRELRRFLQASAAVMAVACCMSCGAEAEKSLAVSAGEARMWGSETEHFVMTGQALCPSGAEASLWFHTSGDGDGYEVRFHDSPIDGSLQTGSLVGVRNLYRSLAGGSEWFDFEVAVRQKNISVKVNGTEVVCYTEPDEPWRDDAHQRQRLGSGRFCFEGRQGRVSFRNLTLKQLGADDRNPSDTLPPVDEKNDSIIRLQQRFFPVIDYHVHLKGGLTKEQAHAMSMNYGINYGVAPNLGEGGVGRMLADDDEALAYYEEVKPMAFLMGAQGEGRRWTVQFSSEAISLFDYIFTDAMTVVDHGRICRIYHPEEVLLEGRTRQEYMDMIVDQTVKILTYEPADIYANATYIPDDWMADYDRLWTDERVDQVLDVLQRYGIAMEISPRYKIPSFDIIRKAKARGLKFTFGTNNVDADFGRLEYAIEAIRACGLTAGDIWFPSMSRRTERKAVDYNHFAAKE